MPHRPSSSLPAGYFSPAPPRVIAHRGLAVDAPENTLLAFSRAVALGVTHLETDVHVSSDGVAMISHDPDLTRLVGRQVSVSQLNSRELGRIQLGAGQAFCSLAEALDAFPEARFNIDIKVAGVAAPAAAAIVAANAVGRVLVSSFGDGRRREAVRRLPGVATSVSARGAVASVALANIGAVRPLARVLRGVHAVQLPTSLLRMRTFSPRALASFHAVGVEVHAWTINEPAEMRSLLAAGVDGLITDRADLALQVLRAP